ncbi:MAG: T9SS type A sorting domain-containing protein, partial [Crocinitomicaceae bacterium]|nr:T9SS type A sorting domain-containing protein [Crocinitomicaceae bacterium]
PIQGETGQNHIGLPPYGSYEVEVISAEGCSAFSDPLVTAAGINEIVDNGVKVHPNPTESIIKLESDEEITDVQLIDIAGNSILIDAFNKDSLDLTSLTSGTYFLSTTTNKGTSTIKIVKL